MRSCRVVSVNWPDGSGHSFNDTPGVGGSMASVNIYLNVDACREVFTESGSRHKTSIKSFGDAGWRALWIILASILSFWTLKAIAETDHFPFERPATPVTGPRSKLHSKGSQPSMQSTFKSVRAWRRAGSPVPIAPISHTNDGRLKTGPGTAWGE